MILFECSGFFIRFDKCFEVKYICSFEAFVLCKKIPLLSDVSYLNFSKGCI